MHENKSCVDVLIAVWNDARTIERAVRSALSDAYVNHVIVIDDASTDDTASVVTFVAGAGWRPADLSPPGAKRRACRGA